MCSLFKMKYQMVSYILAPGLTMTMHFHMNQLAAITAIAHVKYKAVLILF